MIAELQNYIAGILLMIGAAFALIATIGIVRLPDIYSRMHAASKAGTVGSGAMLIALAVFADEPAATFRAIVAVAFLMLTAPVSAHLLAKAAYSVGYRLWDRSVLDDFAGNSEDDTREEI